MAYDGIVMRSVIDDLQNKLLNGRVDKIQQPKKLEIIIQLHTPQSKYRLLISSQSQNARLHLTEKNVQSPSSPPSFCQMLRKHLQGSRLNDIKQISLERIVQLDFSAFDELGNPCRKSLMVEIMGKHSNVFLINEEGLILDCLRRVSSTQSQQREAYPGLPYVLPPVLGKTNPLACSEEELRYILTSSELDQRLDKILLDSFAGFSKQISQGLIRSAGLVNDSSVSTTKGSGFENVWPKAADLDEYAFGRIWQYFHFLIQQINTQQYSPYIVYYKQNMKDFGAIALPGIIDGLNIQYGQIHTVIDSFFNQREQAQSLQAGIDNLQHLISDLQKKLLYKCNLQQDILGRQNELNNLRRHGEILTAFLYKIKPGTIQITLTDIYDPKQKEIIIDLDPALSPSENAQARFRQYNKLKRAITFASQHLLELQTELDYLDTVQISLNNCTSLQDLHEIQEELRDRHYLKEKTVSKTKLPSKPEYNFHVFYADNGTEILVGKNNRQNDYLTFKVARGDDIWLHAKDIPGSHVIIRNHGRPVSDSTLRKAAELAAWFSKYRRSANVPVDYTKACNVQKPRGAKPGFVNYFHQKTIVADPKEP